MNHLLRLLKFFNLLDRAGNISLTNTAVFILLVRVAIAPTIEWSVVGAMLITFIGYSHKRIEERKAAKEESQAETQIKELNEKIEEMDSKVSALSLSAGLKRNV